MSEKTVDLTASVYEICTAHPEVKAIMADVGFDEIIKPGRLATMGRFMTIPKGCEHKKIELASVAAALRAAGFTVTGADVPEASTLVEKPEGAPVARTPAERQELIRSLLERLGAGEDVEDVREDFRRSFESVSGSEIAAAEQALIRDGVAVEEVQRLCDVHATLFEGGVSCAAPAGAAEGQPGHPVRVMREENERILAFLDSVSERLDGAGRTDGPGDPGSVLAAIADGFAPVFVHYKRKEELLFPHLENHDVTGPSSVMWGKDDEVRGAVSGARRRLQDGTADAEALADAAGLLAAAVEGARSMVDKEENVLIPLSLETLSATEWTQIAAESAEFGFAFIDEPAPWRADALELAGDRVRAKMAEGDGARGAAGSALDAAGRVRLSTGSFTVPQLEAVFNTIPLDITFVDADDRTRYFSHGDTRAFPRPKSCLGRDVYDCHPPKSRDMVRHVLESFKSGESDSFEFWIHRDGAFLYIRYLAVRGGDGSYLGALETTQDITRIHGLQGDNRRGADIRREQR